MPIKTAGAIDRQNLCKGARVLYRPLTIPRSFFLRAMTPSNIRMRGRDTALTQSDRLMPKRETLLKLFIKSYLS